MSKLELAIMVLLLCLGQLAQAAGDPARGKQKSQVCIKCHGVGGNSTDPSIPKIQGQFAGYIVAATTEFKKGIRKNPQMENLLGVFDKPQDLQDIAAYFSSQPIMKGKPTGSELAGEGKDLFGHARCNYCHFVEGKRFAPYESEPPPPYITGQHKVYLIKAIHDIRDGKRPADPYGLMKEDISNLSDQQIEAIAEYLSGL